jgi:uncharacterized protein YmfQ (DUF2313 family)
MALAVALSINRPRPSSDHVDLGFAAARVQVRRSHRLPFPATTVQLLPEWQLSLGLPDPCAGSDPTLQQEQQQILARFIAGGGQSADYYIQFAATLGYTITITEFAPFRAGINAAGQPVNGEAWAWAWEINGPTIQLEYFTVGSSSVGMPLASAVGGNALECELSRLSPAHTVLIFNL